MKDMLLTCLILLGICAVGGWLYMMYDCLRDVFKPGRPWQRHWKWRLAALLVNITILVGGILVIVMVTAIMMEINKVT